MFILIIVLGIFLFFKIRPIKNRIIGLLVVFLILFICVSFIFVMKQNDLQFDNFSNITHSFKVYFSWITNLFRDLKTFTANVINMNWRENSNNKEKDYMIG